MSAREQIDLTLSVIQSEFTKVFFRKKNSIFAATFSKQSHISIHTFTVDQWIFVIREDFMLTMYL